MDGITEKQKRFIEDMMEFIDDPFDFKHGTKQTASAYISKHIDQFKLETTSNWCLNYGEF